MELEAHRQRRNLLGTAIALMTFEIAGGTIGPVTLLGGGVTLSKAEWVIRLTYLALGYQLWRYWLYMRPEHLRFTALITESFRSSREYRRRVDPWLEAFKDESGIAYAEGFQSAAIEDTPDVKFIPVPVSESIRYGVFRRSIVFTVDNQKGDFSPDTKEHRVPLLWYECLNFRVWTAIAIGDKSFSDLFVPYVPAFVATAVFCIRTLCP